MVRAIVTRQIRLNAFNSRGEAMQCYQLSNSRLPERRINNVNCQYNYRTISSAVSSVFHSKFGIWVTVHLSSVNMLRAT
jgi:hypothetical protein